MLRTTGTKKKANFLASLRFILGDQNGKKFNRIKLDHSNIHVNTHFRVFYDFFQSRKMTNTQLAKTARRTPKRR